MIETEHHASPLRTAWALTKPYFSTRRSYKAWILVALVVGLNVTVVYTDVLMSDWSRRFFNAAQEKNMEQFWRELAVFPLVLVAIIASSSFGQFFNQVLRLRWRAWLTRQCLRLWMKDHAFYRIRWSKVPLDNPDQRISEDVTAFVDGTVNLSAQFLSAFVGLASFGTILWRLSGDGALRVPGLGLFHIPGLLVWGAVIYAAIGTFFIHRVGKPLVPLHVQHEKREADFRFGLVHVRENAETVALYGGEKVESKGLLVRFRSLLDNTWDIIKRRFGLDVSTHLYSHSAQVIPWLLAGQRYFAGAMKFGDVMQAVSSFGHVRGSLSVIVNNYVALASWRATLNRLAGFAVAAHETRTMAPTGEEASPASQAGVRLTLVMGMSVAPPPLEGAGIVRVQGSGLSVQDLSTKSPDGAAIGGETTFEVSPGERVLLSGPSGSGKTTLLRVVAGIWPFGTGRVEVPPVKTLFLSQRTYLPLGTLRDAVTYPRESSEVPVDVVTRVMTRVGLTKFIPSLDVTADWFHQLSLGEQQRIAFARALLVAPGLLVLDEATSALDPPAEADMYGLLATELPSAMILSIGHHTTLERLHTRKVLLGLPRPPTSAAPMIEP
jgi:vitamin B12/bleomycin/antimicrobial peptide transport system ATP-binding/permease protein